MEVVDWKVFYWSVQEVSLCGCIVVNLLDIFVIGGGVIGCGVVLDVVI